MNNLNTQSQYKVLKALNSKVVRVNKLSFEQLQVLKQAGYTVIFQ